MTSPFAYTPAYVMESFERWWPTQCRTTGKVAARAAWEAACAYIEAPLLEERALDDQRIADCVAVEHCYEKEMKI